MKSSIFEPRYILTRLALYSILLSSIVYGTGSAADQLAQTDLPPRAGAKPLPAELSYAESRIEEAKTKLEQAQRQLAFAKASVRAAEAELKASKADKQALMLRTAAEKLADVSTSSANQGVAKPLPSPNSNKMVDLGNTRLQGWDPSSQPEKVLAPSSEETAQGRQGAPAPSLK